MIDYLRRKFAWARADNIYRKIEACWGRRHWRHQGTFFSPHAQSQVSWFARLCVVCCSPLSCLCTPPTRSSSPPLFIHPSLHPLCATAPVAGYVPHSNIPPLPAATLTLACPDPSLLLSFLFFSRRCCWPWIRSALTPPSSWQTLGRRVFYPTPPRSGHRAARTPSDLAIAGKPALPHRRSTHLLPTPLHYSLPLHRFASLIRMSCVQSLASRPILSGQAILSPCPSSLHSTSWSVPNPC